MPYSRQQVIGLYRKMMRTAAQFENYNFREYFLRRTRDSFRQHAAAPDNTALVDQALQDLQVLKRQAQISQMFHFDKLVVEKLHPHH
jgi:hypothetical protein